MTGSWIVHQSFGKIKAVVHSSFTESFKITLFDRLGVGGELTTKNGSTCSSLNAL